MKKTIGIIGSLVLIAAVCYFLFFKKEKETTEYTTAFAKKGIIVREITATGTLNAFQTIDVGTQVSGIISKIFVDFNDIVKQGQVIALIDTKALLSSVTEAEANMLKANSQHVQQKREYDRYVELLAKNAVSQSDFDLVNANYIAAQSALKSAEAQLDKAKTNLSYATITAPMSGIVISRDVNIGQTVAASFSTPRLFTIANNLTKMQLQARIDEADIGYIKNGQEVTFSVDAYPDTKFEGVVQQIRLQPISTQNVVTYNVMIDAHNPGLKLLPGMSANLSIKVEEHSNVLTIPLAALFFSPSPDYPVGSNTTEATVWVACNKGTKDTKEFNGVTMCQVIIHKGLDNGTAVEVLDNSLSESSRVFTGIKEPGEKKKTDFLGDPPKDNPLMDNN